MRVGRLLPALFVSAALTAALLVLSGAGAAANGSTLSSPQGVDAYLQSVGVNPASVVHQSGLLNYAGPKCPGKGWSCTTNTRVVQIAAAGGQNSVDCSGESFTEEGQSCIVVQTGADNRAVCIERSTAADETQSCSITQTGSKNDATVDQSIDQNGGVDPQDAVQTADVTQTSDGVFNHASISQTVNQSTNDGTDQQQDGHQSAVVSQTATNDAGNDLQADQSQSQKAFGGTTQDQNANASAETDCSTNQPTQPNECANIQQSSDTGGNTSHLRQSMNQDANAGSGEDADQQQGTVSGGIEARVHQETTGDGKQFNDADQDKHQHMSGPDGSSQTQFDPVFCCGAGSQVGGGTENISQQAAQDATEPEAVQELALLGQSLTADGTCSIKQHARNNVDSATNADSLTPCPFLALGIVCANGPEIEIEGSSDVGIQQQLPPGCETFESTGNDFCLLACDVGPLNVFALRQN
jgi:hypothetical protein